MAKDNFNLHEWVGNKERRLLKEEEEQFDVVSTTERRKACGILKNELHQFYEEHGEEIKRKLLKAFEYEYIGGVYGGLGKIGTIITPFKNPIMLKLQRMNQKFNDECGDGSAEMVFLEYFGVTSRLHFFAKYSNKNEAETKSTKSKIMDAIMQALGLDEGQGKGHHIDEETYQEKLQRTFDNDPNYRNDIDTDGYVENMREPDLQNAIDALKEVWEEWKSGPATEANQVSSALQDLLNHIRQELSK